MKDPFVYVVSLFAAIGGLLLGYDTGAISGVLEFSQFNSLFNPSDWQKGLIVSLFQAGCVVGALGSNFLADRVGRNITIFVGSCILCIGAILQVSSFVLGQLYVGRIVAGLGIGVLSMIVPLYQSEVAPKRIRGTLIALQQLAITCGIMFGFWLDYGLATVNEGWRISLSLQLFPAIVLLFILLMPQSPRWLISMGREEEAVRNLRRIRTGEDEVETEVREIQSAVQESESLRRQSGWSDVFTRRNRLRLFIGVMMQVFQQFTGINAIMYYAPAIFASVVQGNNNLLAQGINGTVNFITTIPALFVIDRFGRKAILMCGGVGMCVSFIIVTILFSQFAVPVPNSSNITVPNSSAGAAIIVMICLFVANFAYSWGPVGWIVPAEVFPQHHRARMMSLAVAANWLTNILVSFMTPILLQSIQYNLFIIFICLLGVMTAFVFFVVPETRGKSLEEVDLYFNPRGTADMTSDRKVKDEQDSDDQHHFANETTKADELQ